MTVRIAILVEGATETAFKKALIAWLHSRLPGKMPKLDFLPEDGRIPKGEKLQRKVRLLLKTNDAVIALTDVYTGTNPPDFKDAADARAKMTEWVGPEPRFHPHAAQHEFEAWLLPYWPQVQAVAKSKNAGPAQEPESVNHGKPPSRHIADIFRTSPNGRRYSKTRDGMAILAGQDLQTAAALCPELMRFLTTILMLSGGETG